MAEDTTQTAQGENNSGQPQEVDWQTKYEEMKTHMREWEKKAKANQTAADELEKLKAEQMSEQEKAIARAEAAEKELAALQAEKELTETANAISKEYGVDVDLLSYCKDENAMREFAKKYAEEHQVQTLPSARSNTRIVHSGGEPKKTNGDLFAEVAAELFNK